MRPYTGNSFVRTDESSVFTLENDWADVFQILHGSEGRGAMQTAHSVLMTT